MTGVSQAVKFGKVNINVQHGKFTALMRAAQQGHVEVRFNRNES